MRWFSKLGLLAAITFGIASAQTLGPPGGGGGSSGVSSIAVACGIATSGSTGAVTISGETVDNAISSTTDTINTGDCGRTERYTGASAAVTVPASTGFPVSFTTDIKCETSGTACVLTPSGTTINGSAGTITIASGSSITLYLDLAGTPVWHTKPGNIAAAGQIPGTATNDNGAAGTIGEFISATSAGVVMSSGTPINITSISLTAGDWDVSGVAAFEPGTTTNVTVLIGSISTSTGTIGTDFVNRTSNIYGAGSVLGSANSLEWALPTVRVSLATTTTVFLVSNAFFTISTMTGTGTLQARRAR